MKNKLLFIAAIALSMAFPAFAQESIWTIDSAHSKAEFEVSYMALSSVSGEFSNISGVIRLNEKDLAGSSVEAIIATNSLSTHLEERDKHLKSADFFDVAKFPTLTFRSKQVARVRGSLQITGDLTMHGVTRQVVLAVEDPGAERNDGQGTPRRSFKASASLDRRQFGLVWGGLAKPGEMVIGNDVGISIELETIKQAAPPPVVHPVPPSSSKTPHSHQ